MAYIVMGKDECGTEFRVVDKEFHSMEEACVAAEEARPEYPEARSIWAELYKDKYYFMAQMADRHPDDEYEDQYR